MKPAWLTAGRSINRFEYRWRRRHDFWSDWNVRKARMPRFRNQWMGRGEWYPALRNKPWPKSRRFRDFLRGSDLPF
jgi:hypothetical protein